MCDPIKIIEAANDIAENLEILRVIRDKNGMTCGDIARELGFAKHNTVSFYENGFLKIPHNILCKWLKLLNVNFLELFALKQPVWLVEEKQRELVVAKKYLAELKPKSELNVENFSREILFLAFKKTGLTDIELSQKVGTSKRHVRAMLSKTAPTINLFALNPYLPILKVSMNELCGVKIPKWYVEEKKKRIKDLESDIQKLKSQPL